MTQPNCEKKLNILQKLIQYLRENVNSSYDMSIDYDDLKKSDVDLEYFDVRNNEELVRLLIAFITNPSEEFYHHMRSKLMKVKNIDLDKLFVKKRNDKSQAINRSAPMSLIEKLDLHAGYYEDYSNDEFSLNDKRVLAVCDLFIQSHKSVEEFRNLQQTPEEFMNRLKVDLSQHKDIDVPLFVDVQQIVSILSSGMQQYDEAEVSAHYNMYDLLNLLFYLPVSSGQINLPFYLSADKNYLKLQENIGSGKYVSLDALYSALLDLLADNEFISYKKLCNVIQSLPRENFKKLAKLSEFADKLEQIVEEEEIYEEEMLQRQYHEMCRKKHKSSKIRYTFDSQDNMWDIDLSSQSARDKFSREQEGRMWSDSWSQSLINALEDESGDSNMIDMEFLSKESILALLNDEDDVKMKAIPILDFYKRLELLCRDLTDDNLDHFIRNVEKLLKYLVEIDNRDLVSQLKRKNEKDRKETSVALVQSINDSMNSVKDALANKHLNSKVLSDTLDVLVDVKRKILSRM